MRYFLPFLVAVSAFCLPALAASPEGMGFYPVNAKVIPAAVQRAAGSTFRLVLPDGNRIKLNELTDAPTVAEALKRLEALDDTQIAALDKAVFIYQITRCGQKAVSECELFDSISEGTGFITNDGLTMRTALHVVRTQLQYGWDSSDNPLQVFVLGPNDEIIFTPDTLKITAESTGAKAKQLDDEETNHKLQDAVTLRLSQKIGEPLILAKSAAKPGDRVYLAGFVKVFSDRQNYGAPNSDGHSRMVSIGHVMNKAEAFQRATNKFGSFPVDTLNSFLKNLIVHTADGGPRLSGAPTLNEAGEVVGLYNAGAPESGEAEPLRFSYSIPVQDFK